MSTSNSAGYLDWAAFAADEYNRRRQRKERWDHRYSISPWEEEERRRKLTLDEYNPFRHYAGELMNQSLQNMPTITAPKSVSGVFSDLGAGLSNQKPIDFSRMPAFWLPTKKGQMTHTQNAANGGAVTGMDGQPLAFGQSRNQAQTAVDNGAVGGPGGRGFQPMQQEGGPPSGGDWDIDRFGQDFGQFWMENPHGDPRDHLTNRGEGSDVADVNARTPLGMDPVQYGKLPEGAKGMFQNIQTYIQNNPEAAGKGVAFILSAVGVPPIFAGIAGYWTNRYLQNRQNKIVDQQTAAGRERDLVNSIPNLGVGGA